MTGSEQVKDMIAINEGDSALGKETGRKFIFDNQTCELANVTPEHDDWLLYVEFCDADGDLWYTSGNEEEHYTLGAEEFGDAPDEMAITAKTMWVVCRQCGESFHDLAVAYLEHQPGACGSDQGWDVTTEAGAF